MNNGWINTNSWKWWEWWDILSDFIVEEWGRRVLNGVAFPDKINNLLTQDIKGQYIIFANRFCESIRSSYRGLFNRLIQDFPVTSRDELDEIYKFRQSFIHHKGSFSKKILTLTAQSDIHEALFLFILETWVWIIECINAIRSKKPVLIPQIDHTFHDLEWIVASNLEFLMEINSKK